MFCPRLPSKLVKVVGAQSSSLSTEGVIASGCEEQPPRVSAQLSTPATRPVGAEVSTGVSRHNFMDTDGVAAYHSIPRPPGKQVPFAMALGTPYQGAPAPSQRPGRGFQLVLGAVHPVTGVHLLAHSLQPCSSSGKSVTESKFPLFGFQLNASGFSPGALGKGSAFYSCDGDGAGEQVLQAGGDER